MIIPMIVNVYQRASISDVVTAPDTIAYVVSAAVLTLVSAESKILSNTLECL